MTFNPATGRFLSCDGYSSLLDTTLTGVATSIGVSVPLGVKGLAFANGVLYGANGRDDSLHKLDPTGAPIATVDVTLAGETVDMNGLAVHPVTGELWGIFGRPGFPQYLGTVDPVTGAATSVGPLPDVFEDIAFVPEPSSLLALGAGAIALALCAAHRRRSERSHSNWI